MGTAHDPHYGPWTVEQVLALGEDRGQRRELMGDTLVMAPAPGATHQSASSLLWLALRSAAKAAGAQVRVFEAVNVRLPDALLIPDVVVVDAGAGYPVAFDAEAVQLVVEIVSPSSMGRKTDRLLKPPYYAEAGIPYLWRLEFEPSPILVVAELEAGRYVDKIVAKAGTRTLIEKPFPVSLDPADLIDPQD
ncbi:Uma2 family endonuclease [Actinacidiphila acididurans]|uniref:Uma2 family endonuclease n=1 Tax=Actinacidiphila acididurans TaxID=2784346 RepID=A0ABS2TQR4_9ACTN|nr:Uma2 family endonuclease [Actinacidiphila acididurans]MBM9505177.1 Uma2 family endonuclease [Actinacidiphila acididurans]